MGRAKHLLFQRQFQETRMEENKSVPVENTETEVSFYVQYIHLFRLNWVVTLKLLATQVREADEKEDTVAMPPPQVIIEKRM